MARRKETKQLKECQMCHIEYARPGEKFCKECRKVVMAMMKADGYLESVPNKITALKEQRDRPVAVSTEALGGSAELNNIDDD